MPEKISPVALLLQHGLLDPDISATSATTLHAALLPYYAGCPERLAIKIYSNMAHTISRPESSDTAAAQQELRKDIDDWFSRFL